MTTAQRHCQCGEPIASPKKRYCWECEGKVLRERKAERLKVKRARRKEGASA